MIFNKRNANDVWLQNNENKWNAYERYVRMKESQCDLKVVNDLANPRIKDIQEYVDLTKGSQCEKDMIIVAADHRGVFKDLRKSELAV